MVVLNQCATPSELLGLLKGDYPDDSHPIVQHIGACSRCQIKLDSLVATPKDWDAGKDMLMLSRYWTMEGPDSKAIHESSRAPRSLPATIGNYHIVKTIGYGGMATVYQGVDPELNRVVAIKLLHEHLAVTGASRQRFLKEAQAAASIVHPNVIPIYGIHLTDGRPFLAMPLISGGSLQQRLDRDGPLPLQDALNISLQIAEALEAAHAKGVIHRDVKPANILLEDGNNRVILSDFGLARTLDDANQTASGLISGTPAYMSPEQARGEQVDARTDLYSLGCVLYAMCTGHAPYEATSPLKLIQTVQESQFPSVHRYQEQLPGWIDNLIQQLVEKTPEDRLPNATQAAEMIRACLLHSSDNSSPLPTFSNVHKRMRNWLGVRRINDDRKWPLSVFALTLVLVVILGPFIIRSSSPPLGAQSAPASNISNIPRQLELPYETDPSVMNNSRIEPSDVNVFFEIQTLQSDIDRTLSQPIFQ